MYLRLFTFLKNGCATRDVRLAVSFKHVNLENIVPCK